MESEQTASSQPAKDSDASREELKRKRSSSSEEKSQPEQPSGSPAKKPKESKRRKTVKGSKEEKESGGSREKAPEAADRSSDPKKKTTTASSTAPAPNSPSVEVNEAVLDPSASTEQVKPLPATQEPSARETPAAGQSEEPEPEVEVSLECENCGQVFLTEAELRDHEVKIRGDRGQCEPFTVGKLCYYRGKMFLERREKKCPICDFQFNCYVELECHLSTEHALLEQFSCLVCEAKFENLRRFRDHWSSHRGSEVPHAPWKPLECSQCAPSPTFLKQKEYIEHMHAKHNETKCPYRCPQCEPEDERFALYEELLRHMQLEHAYQCSRCSKAFRTKRECNKHCKKTHESSKPDTAEKSQKEPPRSDEESPKPDTAEGSQEKLLRSDAESGETSNSGEVPPPAPVFNCDRCEQTFVCEINFSRHARDVHGRKLEIECRLCLRRFRNMCFYEKHLQEVLESPLENECRKCNITFASDLEYVWHMAFQKCESKPQTYRCDLFVKKFDSVPKPRIHTVIRKDLSTDQCVKCGEIFKSQNEALNHQKLKHVRAARGDYRPIDVIEPM